MHDHLERNPLETNAINRYHSNNRPNEFVFTQDEYARIKKHCLNIQNENQVFWHGAVVAAWNTGLRMHDIAYLHVDQVHLNEGRIVLVPNKTRRLAKAVEIPILPELDSELRKITCAPLFFPEMASSYDKHGNKVLSVQFGRILDGCGIEGKSFHSFRHRVSSALLNAGTPLSVVSSITGQTIQTLQRYSHAGSEQRAAAMKALI